MLYFADWKGNKKECSTRTTAYPAAFYKPDDKMEKKSSCQTRREKPLGAGIAANVFNSQGGINRTPEERASATRKEIMFLSHASAPKLQNAKIHSLCKLAENILKQETVMHMKKAERFNLPKQCLINITWTVHSSQKDSDREQTRPLQTGWTPQ